ncbi:MAG: hypothetical protein KBA82_11925 [Nitrosomonas sp.]|nr:hypothetical protein [Nitrosomonas sp.]MBP7113645.1 hypothetical protein [Nitrosomonas sp.]
MLNNIDFTLTANDLLMPGISNTISDTEPADQHGHFVTDLFPNTTYATHSNAFTSIEFTFKADDEIVFFILMNP